MMTTDLDHTLWLLKLKNLTDASPPSASNKYVPQMVMNFADAFKSAAASFKDMEIVYIGKCVCPLMKSAQTVLPTQQYDIVIVTRSDTKSFLDSSEFAKISNKYPLEHQTYIPFKVKSLPRPYSMFAATQQFISRSLGYLLTFDPTLGYAPPHPFKNGSYDPLKNLLLTKI